MDRIFGLPTLSVRARTYASAPNSDAPAQGKPAGGPTPAGTPKKGLTEAETKERKSLAQGLADGSKEISIWTGLVELWPYVWPKNDAAVRTRVSIAVVCLLASKLLNVAVPLFFKQAVDDLTKYTDAAAAAAATHAADGAAALATVATSPVTYTSGAIAVLLGYGIARATASLTNELRSAIFAQVTLDGIYKITTNLFRHLLNMDLRFHAEKNTGALSRSIDRGTRSISLVFTMLAFNIVPTAFEVRFGLHAGAPDEHA